MSSNGVHRAPKDALQGLIEAIVDQALDRIIERLEARLAPALPDLDAYGLEPIRVYTAKEVADLLGTTRVASIYEIPEDQLPRVRRIGSSIGFLGINVLSYMHRLPPIDIEAYVD